MTEHLNPENLKEYAQRTASPAMLLSWDDHVAVCAACRDRLSANSALARWAATVRDEEHDTAHLSYEQLAARSENRVPDGERFSLESHLKHCASCREELADLKAFQGRLQLSSAAAPGKPHRQTSSWIYGAAAAAAAVAIVGLWAWRGTQGPAPLQIPAGWTAQDRSLVQQALAKGSLPFQPPPADLSSKQGTLLGAATPNLFAPTSPLGVVVEGDRPEFRWQELAGASSYRVEIYSGDFRMVAQSPELKTTSWTAEQALERGQLYHWQVVATTAKSGAVTVPSPPAAEAGFRVLDAATEDRITKARAEGPMGHLLAASLLAEAGMRAEAVHELEALPPEVRGAIPAAQQ